MDIMSTAQLLGNFGEFVGPIAILVTLVYLGIQVRKSQIAAKADTFTCLCNIDEACCWAHAPR
jgi:hypothetical protein